VNEHDSRVHRSGDFALDDPLPSGATEPVDVAQVRADDALIAAMSTTADMRVNDPIDERLGGLLRAWRDDVRTGSQGPLVDIDTAMVALASARRTRTPRRPTSLFGPLATAAAVLVVAFIGLGLAARSAEPGDALWNVTKVLYSEKAKSVEAKIAVNRKLEQAREALESGNVTAAMFALQEARRTLAGVNAEDGQQELATETEQLIAELSAAPNTSPPPPPPSVPATNIPAITSDPPTSASTTTTVPPSTTTEESTVTTTTEVVPEGTPSTVPGTVPGQTTQASAEPQAGGGDEPSSATGDGSTTD
jgi:Anti-sigma-D factor RsdA to sigma factor binding region